MIARFFRTLTLGFKTLLLHKLRSGLAMLGILIGVTAVIWLVALGEGVSYQAQQQIKDLGATNIIIKSIKPSDAASGAGAGSFIVEYGLKRADYDRIINSVPMIRRAVPMREIKSQASAGGRLADVQLLGCTPAYFDINHLTMDRGRFLEDRDVEVQDNVAVIASETAKLLFPYENPIGKRVHVTVNDSNQLFRIIGQTASRNPSAAIGGSLEGRSYNLDIYIPISTFHARIGDQVVTAGAGSREGELIELNQITLTVGEIDEVEPVAGLVEFLLEKFHKKNDTSVIKPVELLNQARRLRTMFNVLLVLIAGISLVVGGIGIMNIMLATVTERTREIGVRRALGAKQRDIVMQFLAETVVLSATGGVIGVLFGFLCIPTVPAFKWLVTKGLPEIGVTTLYEYWQAAPPTIQNLEPIIAPWSIIAAFGISVGVGIVFGLYPARRAAQMDPIEALRHE